MKTIIVFGVIAAIGFFLWKSGLLKTVIDKLGNAVKTQTEKVVTKDVPFGDDKYVDSNITSTWGNIDEYKSFSQVEK